MKIKCYTPKQSLNLAYLKQKITRNEIDNFKYHLIELLDKIKDIEKLPHDVCEDHLKINMRDFLRDTFYKPTNLINIKDKTDLVIHNGNSINDSVGVIIEAKRPSNIADMLSINTPNRKAIHQLILYYLKERNEHNNIQLKYLIATNINEWFIFDVNYFDKHIYHNSQIRKLYDIKISEKKDNPFFYDEIAKILEKSDFELPCVYFNIKEYDNILRNKQTEDDKDLIALYKILSPQHLLKIPIANDSNSLNLNFYKELLYLIGLEEVKDGGKNIIRRKKDNPNQASLLELTIAAMDTENVYHRIADINNYGENNEERVFNIALELCITWINRILFLKLLEGQLISYHNGNLDYRFLNSEKIQDFDSLFNMFHNVLNKDINDRNEKNKVKFNHIPYLNSSLFEISELEDQTIKINSLQDDEELDLLNTTVLKNIKTEKSKLLTIHYLLKFLDAYDFASEGVEDIQEDSKTLINASVLGKVFEKINGYKDGSIFTPGFITMYMCQQSIRLAVMQKFKEKYNWNIEVFDDIKNYLADNRLKKKTLEYNELINSLRICDPAVGSGHFLVSALNEIIAIKHELGLLADESGERFEDLKINIENDELIIANDSGDIFEYKIKNGKPTKDKIQKLQKVLFHEKQIIIENCLFGVDINPNSVKICRLRLWIELLKNAYYKEPDYSELETLPNIDINIKCGNSLIHSIPLDSDLSIALKTIKWNINDYKKLVNDYKNSLDKNSKRAISTLIEEIKKDIKINIWKYDQRLIRLNKLESEYLDKYLTPKLIYAELSEKQKKDEDKEKRKIESQIKLIKEEFESINKNQVYRFAFEWRFEYPEVLNDFGDFIGFDLVIGNPPYVQLQKESGRLAMLLQTLNYNTFERTGDIYSLFYERGWQILKQDGILCFITSNKWMRAGYGQKTRFFFSKNTNPLLLIDFSGYKVFDSALVDSNILLFTKSQNQYLTTTCNLNNDFNKNSILNDYIKTKANKSKYIDEQSWTIQNDIESRIKGKIEAIGTPLKDWKIKINYGIKTGINKAFIIDGKMKDEIIATDPQSTEIIKPILRGRDIRRFKADFKDLWIIMFPKGFTIKSIQKEDNLISEAAQIEESNEYIYKTENNNLIISEAMPRYGYYEPDPAWQFITSTYPAISNHLSKYKSLAEIRQDQGDYWWEQRACSYLNEFKKEKIVYPNITQTPCFSYSNKLVFSNDKSFIMTSESINIKFLLAFLNSYSTDFMLRQLCSGLGLKGLEVRKIFIENLTIPDISIEPQQPFIDLVDIILAKKENNEDTTEEEREIDMMVYKHYDLTEEEIRIIEG